MPLGKTCFGRRPSQIYSSSDEDILEQGRFLTSVDLRRKEILDPVQREDSHGPMGSVMMQEAQECQDHLNLGRAKMGSSLGPRRKVWPC